MRFLLPLLFFAQQLLASDPSSLILRTAQVEDVDTLYDLIGELALFEGKDLATLPVTKENLKKFGFGEFPYYHVVLAENENGVIGYALYNYGFSGHQGKPFVYIDDLYVKPAERAHGVGTRLLQRVAQQAESHGCCRMEWHVFDWNEKAIDFYLKIGGVLRKDLLLIRLNSMDTLQNMHP